MGEEVGREFGHNPSHDGWDVIWWKWCFWCFKHLLVFCLNRVNISTLASDLLFLEKAVEFCFCVFVSSGELLLTCVLNTPVASRQSHHSVIRRPPLPPSQGIPPFAAAASCPVRISYEGWICPIWRKSASTSGMLPPPCWSAWAPWLQQRPTTLQLGPGPCRQFATLTGSQLKWR